MALQITEFNSNYLATGTRLPVANLPPLATQSVAVGATSVASAAFSDNTMMVRLVAAEDCRIVVATAPTALSTSLLLIAGGVEYFGVQPSAKIAVIAA